MTYIAPHQIVLPKFIRDNLTVEKEEIVLGMIDFAYEQGRDRGYAEGYMDAFDDHATTKTVDAQ